MVMRLKGRARMSMAACEMQDSMATAAAVQLMQPMSYELSLQLESRTLYTGALFTNV